MYGHNIRCKRRETLLSCNLSLVMYMHSSLFLPSYLSQFQQIDNCYVLSENGYNLLHNNV